LKSLCTAELDLAPLVTAQVGHEGPVYDAVTFVSPLVEQRLQSGKFRAVRLCGPDDFDSARDILNAQLRRAGGKRLNIGRAGPFVMIGQDAKVYLWKDYKCELSGESRATKGGGTAKIAKVGSGIPRMRPFSHARWPPPLPLHEYPLLTILTPCHHLSVSSVRLQGGGETPERAVRVYTRGHCAPAGDLLGGGR
jgi:hypothetical protein